MIVVAGQMTVNPAVIGSMTAAIATMRGKVLGEAGCHHYSLLMEDSALGIVNVLEIWDDDAALIVHLRQPWIVEFVARFGAEMLGSTVRVYDVAGVRPLPALQVPSAA